MPKLNDRERLAKLEADQRRLSEEAEAVRRSVRASYGSIASDLAIETLTEREFRDILAHAIRAGGSASLAALKALPPVSPTSSKSPERRPSDEHGGAAHRRPASAADAASAGDGTGSQETVP